VSHATRSVEDGPWMDVDRFQRVGFGVVMRALSVAALVMLMMLVSTASGAPGSRSTDSAVQTPSIFAPVSTPAFAIRDLSYFVLGICAVIFIVVAGLLVYSLIRFRRRPADADREPPQVYGSNQIELAWTVVPVLIVVILFLATARYIFGIEGLQATPSALNVTVVGHQWWWEIRYPALGITTANELHVPVSDPANPRPIFLTLESADVIHSFWVPQLAGKMDVIPNKTNRVWIDPHTPGLYVGQCAEYCGLQHAGMLLRVIVHHKDEFAQWVAAEQVIVSAHAYGSAKLLHRLKHTGALSGLSDQLGQRARTNSEQLITITRPYGEWKRDPDKVPITPGSVSITSAVWPDAQTSIEP
jgi:cytochrome c oxidase subunit II